MDSYGLSSRTIEGKVMQNKRFKNFQEFYPYYLSQHQNKICRLLHAYGTFLSLLFLGAVLIAGKFWWACLAPIMGYAFAWIGHFFFEKNKPATFQYPLWSLLGDFKMMKEIVWDDEENQNKDQSKSIHR